MADANPSRSGTINDTGSVTALYIGTKIDKFKYHVDATNGSDSNDGLSSSNAWQTISKVNTHSFFPGDSIGFKRGEIWREQLTIPSSGTSRQPIIFGAYGSGDKPIINASVLATGFSLDSGSIYVKTSFTGFGNMVWEDGTRLVERGSKAAIVGSGEFYIDTTADELYIRTTNDSDPDAHTIEVADKVDCINIVNKEWITIQDLYLTKARGASLANLYLNAASNINIQRCEIQYTGNQVYGIRVDTPTNITIQDCTIHDISNSGIYVRLNGSGVIVKNNEIFNIGQIDITGDRSGITVGNASGNHITGPILIEGNHIYNLNPPTQTNAMSQPIVIDESDDSIIRYNRIHDHNKGGIVVSGDQTSGDGHVNKTEIYYNLIYNMNVDDVTQTGTQVGIYVNNVDDSEIYNNTLYNLHVPTAFGAGIHTVGQTGDTLTTATVKNNIVSEMSGSGGRHTQHRQNATFTSFTADNNHYFDSSSYIYAYAAGTDTSLADVISGTPVEDNSNESDPLFTNAGSDFTLQASSTAVNAGVDVGLLKDIVGNEISNTPDIGAYEII